MENTQIAEIFDEIADLLELQDDNPFRIRSYRSAAQSVRNLSDRLQELAERGDDLSEIPNIGDATSRKIREILETGTCKRLEELRKRVPTGLTELMHIPGVGPRKAMQLHQDLNIESLDDLEKACDAHKVRALEGMGAKTEEKILQGIATVRSTAGRILYQEAADHLASLAQHLDAASEIDRWEVAGSFRRGKETIGDLDILVHATDRGKATDTILGYDAIADVISRGDERVSVRLNAGLQVDFRFFDAPAFGAAWMYFTGSKAHNIRVRRVAQDRGWKLNEYGLFKGDHRLAGKTEKAVYARLDMSWVAPELREDRGEVDAAREGNLPRLIDGDDVHGDLQSHTTASDGKHSIKEMAEAAREYGFDFLAITDHSKRVTMANGLDDDRARKHADAIHEVDSNMKRFWLLAGIEVDILKSGKLDLKENTLEAMDWVVASVHYDRQMSRKAMTDRIVKAVGSGVVHCLGHPLGRIIGRRDPIAVDMDRVIEACIENDVAVEINCQPDRLDLPDNYCRDARDAGVTFTLGTDSHSTDGFRLMPLGVNVARRGWLRKADVLNTKTITELRKVIGH
jgi:DNA polymerase (family 10)